MVGIHALCATVRRRTNTHRRDPQLCSPTLSPPNRLLCTVDNQCFRRILCEVLDGGGHSMEGGDADANGYAGFVLPPCALTAWSEIQASAGKAHSPAPTRHQAGAVLLWSGHESQPTRVSSKVTALTRDGIGRAARKGSAPASASQAPPPSPLPCGWASAVLGSSPLAHRLMLNYRGLRSLDEVRTQIEALRQCLHGRVEWATGSDCATGEGSQQAAFVGGSSLPTVLESAAAALGGTVTLKYEPNPGRSDASHLWRTLPTSLRGERVVPFTCGPGHRSHRDDAGTLRKTHGPMEGFDKETGRACLPFFTRVVSTFSKDAHRSRAEAEVAPVYE
jgi:hypothetical protein